MANKKMNQVEVKAIAKKIIREVNEVNTIYNESVLKSKTYLDEVEKIKEKMPLRKMEKKIEKELKIEFGSNFAEKLKFQLLSISGSKFKEEETALEEELKELKKKSFKKILNENVPSTWNSNKVYDDIVEEITIAQITVSDVQLLINSIKAKLI